MLISVAFAVTAPKMLDSPHTSFTALVLTYAYGNS